MPRGLNPEAHQLDAGDCKSQLRAVWERDLKARNANQGPMATVAAVSMLKNAVAATPMLVNPNPRVRSPHYLPTSAGGAEKQGTRKARSARDLS